MSRLIMRFLMLFLRVVKTPCNADCRCGGHEVLDVSPLGWRVFVVFMAVFMACMAVGCWRTTHSGHEVPQPRYGMTLCHAIDDWTQHGPPEHLMPCPSGGPPPFILVPDPVAVAEAKR